MKFKKDDRVRIRKGTQYASQCSLDGTIKTSDAFISSYTVIFDNGYQNSYTDEDLELALDNKIMAKYKKDVDEFIGVGA